MRGGIRFQEDDCESGTNPRTGNSLPGAIFRKFMVQEINQVLMIREDVGLGLRRVRARRKFSVPRRRRWMAGSLAMYTRNESALPSTGM
jgi:hypothetical protein